MNLKIKVEIEIPIKSYVEAFIDKSFDDDLEEFLKQDYNEQLEIERDCISEDIKNALSEYEGQEVKITSTENLNRLIQAMRSQAQTVLDESKGIYK